MNSLRPHLSTVAATMGVSIAFVLSTCLLVAVAHAGVTQSGNQWTVSYDFDNQNNGDRCDPFLNPNKRNFVSTAESASGNNSCMFEILQGVYGWGGDVSFPQKLYKGDEYWMRFRLFMPQGFDYNIIDPAKDGDSNKFIRIAERDTAGTPNYFGWKWRDNYLSTAYAAALQMNTTSPYWHYFGAQADRPQYGVWETYEIYIKFDNVSVAQGGTARMRAWKNGQLLADLTSLPTLLNATDVAEKALIFSYWNGGSPQTQHLFFDDLVATNITPTGRDAQGNPMIGVGSYTPGPTDTQAPTTPTSLSATAQSYSQVNLSWSPSTDNNSVAGYKIYRNGTQINTTTGTSYSDIGLSQNTTYSYTVAAYDSAGNTSTQSASKSATTPSAPAASQNPVAHWTFDEGAGSTASDSSGNGYHGTLSGSPTWTTGVVGRALDFNGSGSHVLIPNSSALDFGANEEFSISFWMKGSGGTQLQRVFYNRDTAGYLFQLNNGSAEWRIDEGPVNVSTFTNTQINDGTWHHITLGRNGSQHFIYVDGTLDATTNDNSLADLSNTTDLTISTGGTTGLNGTIDDFRIYNRMLSASEIQALAGNSSPSATTCTSFTYSSWGTCQSNNTQTRTVTSSSPSGCTGGTPVTTQSCAYVPPTSPACSDGADNDSDGLVDMNDPGCTSASDNDEYNAPTATTCTSFTYSSWNTCQSNNTQTRTVTASSPSGCTGGTPVTTQSCTYSASGATFSYSSRIQVNTGGSNLNVRSTANGTLVGQQTNGALGTVTGGPIATGGYTWWKVNFDSGIDGWVAENYLQSYTTPSTGGSSSGGSSSSGGGSSSSGSSSSGSSSSGSSSSGSTSNTTQQGSGTTAGTTTTTNWVHTRTPEYDGGTTNVSRTTASKYKAPYFTYRGVDAMLMKVHEANGLIILVAGSGSTYQRIYKQGVLYTNGVPHDIQWTGIWPEESDGYYRGRAYYLLRTSDPLYHTDAAYGAYMRMTLPGCDNTSCSLNDWVLQEYEVN